MPVTVLHLVHRLTAGGAERVLVNLINGSSREINHIVCSFSPADDFKNEIIANKRIVFNLDKRPGNDFRLPFKIASICRKYNVDVVHAQGWATYVEGVIATKILCRRKPGFVFAFRGKTLEDVAGIPMKRLYAQRILSMLCDGIITPSDEMRQDYAKCIGINAHSIRVIHNGIDIEKFGMEGGKIDRLEFGIPAHAHVVGCVARLDPVKNIIWLIETLAPLMRDNDRVYLLIIGDGPEKENIKQIVQKLNLGERVHLAGRRSDIAACLALMDIFVQPSIYEGISNTILEAMGSRLPVIATDVGGTSEIVQNDVTGILVESQNKQQLSSAISRLLHNVPLRINMGRAGRKIVEQKFTVSQMASAYDILFQELAAT